MLSILESIFVLGREVKHVLAFLIKNKNIPERILLGIATLRTLGSLQIIPAYRQAGQRDHWTE